MLTLVEAVSLKGETLPLPLEDLTSGYLITGIDGLDPVKATVVSSHFASIDGVEHQTTRLDERNIVLHLEYKPTYLSGDVRALRSKLYRFFMPKSQVTLRFYFEGEHFVDISGTVESFESPQFSRTPTADISILCPQPAFVSADPIVIEGFTVSDDSSILIDYEGTVETGLTFQMNVDREINGFMIYNNPLGGESQALEFDESLSIDDVLTISTEKGAKSVYLTRLDSTSSFLWGVTPNSNWITLYPGENEFRVLAGGDPIPFTITYRAKYGGL